VQHLVTTLAAVSVLAASLVAGTPSVASAAGCSATNTGTGVRFGSLQSAVTAAAPGDTLRIGGTCIGNVTIAKRLTLVGIGTGPTVRGNGGRPLTIVGGPVTIDRLRITDGVATSCGGAAIQRDASGGGILASVKVTIKRSVVDGNLVSAAGDASGGGIAMTNEATLRVSDSTTATTCSQRTRSPATHAGWHLRRRPGHGHPFAHRRQCRGRLPCVRRRSRG